MGYIGREPGGGMIFGSSGASTISGTINGSNRDFTLPASVDNAQQVMLFVDGVHQSTDKFTITSAPSATLNFNSGNAPATGSEVACVIIQDSFSFATVNDGAITTAKLAAPVAARGGYGTTEARLSLTSGTPVTTADVTGAGTVYLSPYKGEVIMLYTGSAWEAYNLNAVLSISVPATTTTPFDIFLDYNGGTPALAVTNWTNDTTRATALTTQDGVYVQSGNTDWKYLGTGRTTGSSGECEDSESSRLLWNYYNRVPRWLEAHDTTDTWTYTTATWRAKNNSTTVGGTRVEILIGVLEPLVEAFGTSQILTGSTPYFSSGIGIDSTSADSAQMNGAVVSPAGRANDVAVYRGYPAVGYHYIQQLEISQAVDTTTWYGDGGQSFFQTGMVAVLEG